MQEINKEFRHYIEESKLKSYVRKAYITKAKPMPIIGADGNITTKESNKYYLETDGHSRCYRISKDYYGIKHIRDDLYTVLNFNITDPTIVSESIQAYPKFGIIKLKRCVSHPSGFELENERIIAPIAYDRIYVYDSLYPIVEINNHYTYFCIDEDSQNYGKQLLPTVLESACPFNIKYEGFAECIIEGETRFIPIDFIATEKITKEDLLTEEEVISLIKSYEAFRKMNQIGNTEIPENVKRLKRIK